MLKTGLCHAYNEIGPHDNTKVNHICCTTKRDHSQNKYSKTSLTQTRLTQTLGLHGRNFFARSKVLGFI